MKVLIYGSGAVGLGIAASLVSSGCKVDLIAKGKTKDAIDRLGIQRIGLFNEIIIPINVINTSENLDDFNKNTYDFILICTKTNENTVIAKDIYDHSNLLSDDGALVIMQNGWGNEDQYTKYFDKKKIYSARIITGFTRPERNISKITVHASPILIGSLFEYSTDEIYPLVAAINDGGLPCEVTNEIAKALWAKMLYNCTLNPLSAILNSSYGNLTESENSIFIMNNIIHEIFAVMEAGNYKTYWNTAEEYIKVFYEELVPLTFQHRSSTLQDIEKKIRTEIDSLSGSVVKLGSIFKIQTPCNTILYNLIKAMEGNFKQ